MNMKPSSSDVFRPRLPVDPFLHLDLSQPWFVHHPSLTPPSVILVLGAPSQQDLLPLLTSSFLHNALLLIATHSPPPLTVQPQPTVRILQLQTPVHSLGAVHLANLFDRAGHIAGHWHSRPASFGDKSIVRLVERLPGGEFTQVDDDDDVNVCYAFHAPASPTIRYPHRLLKRKSFLNSTHSLPSPSKPRVKDKPQPAQRQFDAILNFLPSSLPEKDTLKYAILVTTLSPPFLTRTTLQSRYTLPDLPKKRFLSFLRSKRSQSDTCDSNHCTVPYSAHLVHILTSSPTITSRTISPSSSDTSLSSAGAALPPPGYSTRHPARTPSFISRPLSSFSARSCSDGLGSSSSTLYTSPSVSPTSTISTPRIGSQSSISSNTPTCKKPKLGQMIEHFLLTFAYPPPPTLPTQTNDLLGFQQKTVPYVVAPGVFGSPVSTSGRFAGTLDSVRSEVDAAASDGQLTVGEVILLGLLDMCAKGEDVGQSLKSVAGLAGRVWIGHEQDVVLALKDDGKVEDDVLPSSLVRMPPLAVPVPARSPSGREKKRESNVIREEGLDDWTLPPNRCSPQRSASSQSDNSSITRPAAVVQRMHVSVTPPPAPDLFRQATWSESTDHSSNGLATPSDSSEHGGTEYETCETYVTAKSADYGLYAKSIREPESYDPYHSAFLDPDWGRVTRVEPVFDDLEDEMPMRKNGFTLKGGVGIRSWSRAVTFSGKAASTMAASTVGHRRNVLRRDREIVRAVAA
ncbi:hypothetical protein APHAL10511_006759 [Amanita phalloides]|nr:hypothetical protein APHAL10511_006759 [Amanita phalloides]